MTVKSFEYYTDTTRAWVHMSWGQGRPVTGEAEKSEVSTHDFPFIVTTSILGCERLY